jgi:hypothetical protein
MLLVEAIIAHHAVGARELLDREQHLRRLGLAAAECPREAHPHQPAVDQVG